MTTHDEWFTPEDRADLEALLTEDDLTCPSCGMPADECGDEQHPWLYETGLRECIPTQELADAIPDMRDHQGRPVVDERGGLRPGMRPYVVESDQQVGQP